MLNELIEKMEEVDKTYKNIINSLSKETAAPPKWIKSIKSIDANTNTIIKQNQELILQNQELILKNQELNQKIKELNLEIDIKNKKRKLSIIISSAFWFLVGAAITAVEQLIGYLFQ